MYLRALMQDESQGSTSQRNRGSAANVESSQCHFIIGDTEMPRDSVESNPVVGSSRTDALIQVRAPRGGHELICHPFVFEFRFCAKLVTMSGEMDRSAG
jgi:hypothetical protein